MIKRNRNNESGGLTRRRLLGVGCGLAAGSLLPLRGALAYSDARDLAFEHLHTGEQVNTVFWSGGRFNEDGLKELKHIMRDWRTGEMIEIDRRLYQVLFELRRMIGTEQPFQIISAYRSPKTNAQLRQNSSAVAKRSLHMQGMAIDVRLPGYSTKGLRDLALKLRSGGVGYYSRSDFVHLDTGRARTWGS
ncbi:MAG: YcbK family protein [Limibacillus sp.]